MCENRVLGSLPRGKKNCGGTPNPLNHNTQLRPIWLSCIIGLRYIVAEVPALDLRLRMVLRAG